MATLPKSHIDSHQDAHIDRLIHMYEQQVAADASLPLQYGSRCSAVLELYIVQLQQHMQSACDLLKAVPGVAKTQFHWLRLSHL